MTADRRRVVTVRATARWLLAALLVTAGASHLTWGRRGYRVVVPDWAPRVLRMDADAVVVASGAVEIVLGCAAIALPRERQRVGWAIAAFFVAVFPGNVHQWRTGRSAPGLRTDRARLARLFLQPALLAWALAATGPHRRR
ncbi:DoxX family protein [Microbacterium sp. RD1]|uniref:DoxX family protein n=1 Tax=Microbacterium sp. RD1 TaxID=3457313 RepID=UPI003FA562C6